MCVCACVHILSAALCGTLVVAMLMVPWEMRLWNFQFLHSRETRCTSAASTERHFYVCMFIYVCMFVFVCLKLICLRAYDNTCHFLFAYCLLRIQHASATLRNLCWQNSQHCFVVTKTQKKNRNRTANKSKQVMCDSKR